MMAVVRRAVSFNKQTHAGEAKRRRRIPPPRAYHRPGPVHRCRSPAWTLGHVEKEVVKLKRDILIQAGTNIAHPAHGVAAITQDDRDFLFDGTAAPEQQ